MDFFCKQYLLKVIRNKLFEYKFVWKIIQINKVILCWHVAAKLKLVECLKYTIEIKCNRWICKISVLLYFKQQILDSVILLKSFTQVKFGVHVPVEKTFNTCQPNILFSFLFDWWVVLLVYCRLNQKNDRMYMLNHFKTLKNQNRITVFNNVLTVCVFCV